MKKYKEDSPAVHCHLGILQNVIQRMSGNSTSSKTWCITLVSAIIVVVADKTSPRLVWISLLPVILFYALDVYYLALEKGFRKSYNDFIDKLQGEDLNASDVYAVTPSGKMKDHVFEALKSFSTWPFYIGLLALISLTYFFVL